MIRHTPAALLLLLASVGLSAAEPVVILVRHAERADAGAAAKMMAADPELSAAGHARAETLARLLTKAGITAIYTTEYRRTQQTAAPLARTLKVEPTIVPASESDDLLRAIRAARGAVLLVGHSNTVPELIAGLGVKEAVTIADDEFDGLFVVFRGSEPALLRLRY